MRRGRRSFQEASGGVKGMWWVAVGVVMVRVVREMSERETVEGSMGVGEARWRARMWARSGRWSAFMWVMVWSLEAGGMGGEVSAMFGVLEGGGGRWKVGE